MLNTKALPNRARAWREGLTPDPLLSVSEWSDRHRMLPARPPPSLGAGVPAARPYLKAIMDCLSPTSPVERVVFMKPPSSGATEMGSNWIGYVIHHAPGPMMAVWPTVEMAKRNSKQRIDPLIEESAALAELISPARSRDSGNTILAKEFRGGVLVMTGANSAVGLRSMPVRYLFLDEVDGYPLDVEGEGDAISLAEARTHLRSAQDLHRFPPTISGRAPSSANTKPATSVATSCRARIVRTAVAALPSSCAGIKGNRRRRPTSANRATVDCRAPQDLDAGAR